MIDYTFPVGGLFFIIIDSFGPGTCGAFTLDYSLSCESPVSVETSSWGLIKHRFRE